MLKMLQNFLEQLRNGNYQRQHKRGFQKFYLLRCPLASSASDLSEWWSCTGSRPLGLRLWRARRTGGRHRSKFGRSRRRTGPGCQLRSDWPVAAAAARLTERSSCQGRESVRFEQQQWDFESSLLIVVSNARFLSQHLGGSDEQN